MDLKKFALTFALKIGLALGWFATLWLVIGAFAQPIYDPGSGETAGGPTTQQALPYGLTPSVLAIYAILGGAFYVAYYYYREKKLDDSEFYSALILIGGLVGLVFAFMVVPILWVGAIALGVYGLRRKLGL